MEKLFIHPTRSDTYLIQIDEQVIEITNDYAAVVDTDVSTLTDIPFDITVQGAINNAIYKRDAICDKEQLEDIRNIIQIKIENFE